MNNVQVGDIVAKEGAWQRKYRVTHILRGEEKHPYGDTMVKTAIVRLEFLGQYWSTTKEIQKPIRPIVREIKTYQADDKNTVLTNYGLSQLF